MLNDEWRTATSQAAGKLPEPGHPEHKELELIDKKFDDAAVRNATSTSVQTDLRIAENPLSLPYSQRGVHF